MSSLTGARRRSLEVVEVLQTFLLVCRQQVKDSIWPIGSAGPTTRLRGFARVDRHAAGVELLRVALMLASGEHVDLVRHDHVGEAGLLEEYAPLCIQQSTGNSAAPERDVVLRILRHLFVHEDVADLDPPSRPEHPEHLREYRTLVRAEVHDAVADDHVGGAIVDR